MARFIAVLLDVIWILQGFVETTKALEIILGLCAGLWTLLLALLVSYVKTILTEHKSTRTLVLAHIEECNEAPKVLILERIENLHGAVIEARQSTEWLAKHFREEIQEVKEDLRREIDSRFPAA